MCIAVVTFIGWPIRVIRKHFARSLRKLSRQPLTISYGSSGARTIARIVSNDELDLSRCRAAKIMKKLSLKSRLPPQLRCSKRTCLGNCSLRYPNGLRPCKLPACVTLSASIRKPTPGPNWTSYYCPAPYPLLRCLNFIEYIWAVSGYKYFTAFI